MPAITDPSTLGEVALFRGLTLAQLSKLNDLLRYKTFRAGEILIPFRLTQRDLAGLVGAARERVNRIMAAYKQRQYISVDQHHHITVRNPGVLRRRVCGVGWSNSKLVG